MRTKPDETVLAGHDDILYGTSWMRIVDVK